MKLDIEKVIFTAPLHRTMISLSREFGMGVTTFKYNLGKARVLELVKKIIEVNKWAH